MGRDLLNTGDYLSRLLGQFMNEVFLFSLECLNLGNYRVLKESSSISLFVKTFSVILGEGRRVDFNP